ncbi:MAG: MBL fold metallo-hydrolase [Pseudomonadota bacterium]
MVDRVVLLGTKGGPAVYPSAPGRLPTSSRLELGGQQIVIDCGVGVTPRLSQVGGDLKSLETIVITHLHSDHYLEFGPLIHTAWTAGLNTPVRVIGPAGLSHYWAAFQQSMAFDIALRIDDEGRPPLSELVSVKVIDDRQMIGDIALSTCRNNHPPIQDSFALRFEIGGKVVVFSGDTAPFDRFTAFAADADLLVHEAMIGEGVDRLVSRVGNGARLKQHLEASHTDAEDVGRIASEARAKRLALHHLVPSDDPLISDDTWEGAVRAGGYAGPVSIGRDLLAIDL